MDDAVDSSKEEVETRCMLWPKSMLYQAATKRTKISTIHNLLSHYVNHSSKHIAQLTQDFKRKAGPDLPLAIQSAVSRMFMVHTDYPVEVIQPTEGKCSCGRWHWSLSKKGLKHRQRTVATAVLDKAGKWLLDRVDKTQLQWAEGTHCNAPRKMKWELWVHHLKRSLRPLHMVRETPVFIFQTIGMGCP